MNILKFLVIILTISYGKAGVKNRSWKDCEKKWPRCKDEINIVCINTDCNPRGKNCYENAPNKKFRQTMVKLHNTVRNEVAGGKDPVNLEHGLESAANMNAVSYDLRLEYLAICHVHGCELNHDKCRAFPGYRSPGQNLAFTGSSKSGSDTYTFTSEDYYNLGNKWYLKERNLTNMKPYLNSFPMNIGQVGHLTQMIWANLIRIGCASAIERGYTVSQQKQNYEFETLHLTCNYMTSVKDFGGNTIGEPIYEVGPPVSKCPDGTAANQEFSNLCGKVDPSDEIDGINPYRLSKGDSEVPLEKMFITFYVWVAFIFT